MHDGIDEERVTELMNEKAKADRTARTVCNHAAKERKRKIPTR